MCESSGNWSFSDYWGFPARFPNPGLSVRANAGYLLISESGCVLRIDTDTTRDMGLIIVVTDGAIQIHVIRLSTLVT